jgi:hypothetical protein
VDDICNAPAPPPAAALEPTAAAPIQQPGSGEASVGVRLSHPPVSGAAAASGAASSAHASSAGGAPGTSAASGAGNSGGGISCKPPCCVYNAKLSLGPKGMVEVRPRQVSAGCLKVH